MHPAFSVIFLTTLIGAGQGLFLALFTARFYALFGLLPAQDGPAFHAGGSAIVLALLIAGLVASFFHLGRPERAWRSAAQWRTSWLSREVIALPAFMGVVFLYGLVHALGWNPVLLPLPRGLGIDAGLLLGGLGTLLAFALFVCTGMIYACLRFLAEWHTPLTVVNFTLLGGASGFTLATLFSALAAPALVGFFAGCALIITLLGMVTRLWSLLRNARLKPKSTLQTAIGIKHPRIRQTSPGFVGRSFNTREFFHGAGAPVLRWIRPLFLLFAFVLPAALLTWVLQRPDPAALVAAVALQGVGLLAERWFFFVQARHPQNLYYQAVT